MFKTCVVAVLMAVLVGCGNKTSGSGEAPAAPVNRLVSMALTPASLTLDPGTTAAITVLGTFEDFSIIPISVNWESSAPSIAGIDPSGVVYAYNEGGAIITATSVAFPAMHATADVTVTTPPPPVTPHLYGHDDDRGFLVYGNDGSVMTEYAFESSPEIAGMHLVGNLVYVMIANVLRTIDINTGEVADIGSIREEELTGLVADQDGVLYSTTRNGRILRIDPRDGGGFSYVFDFGLAVNAIAINTAGVIYVAAERCNPNDVWVYSVNVDGSNAAKAFISIQDSEVATGGMAIGPDGSIYMADAYDGGRVYRGLDASGDGMAEGDEVTVASESFTTIQGIDVDSDGAIWVNDQGARTISQVVGGVTTLLGNDSGRSSRDVNNLKLIR